MRNRRLVAQRPSIESGDVITALNGEMVRDARELVRMISRLVPGNAVRLTVFSTRVKRRTFASRRARCQILRSRCRILVNPRPTLTTQCKGSATRGTDVPQLG